MPPIRTDKLVDPETLSAGRIRHPFRVGLRNSLATLLAIGVWALLKIAAVVGKGYTIDWWVWPLVGSGVIVVCFAHAYLGALIGGRRANDVALIVLFLVLTGIIIWFEHVDKGAGI
jgi:hypothetical protein